MGYQRKPIFQYLGIFHLEGICSNYLVQLPDHFWDELLLKCIIKGTVPTPLKQ